MQRPNLFDFATSELSQDAFIAWLLSWADERLRELDADLHACSRQILARFFALHGKRLPEHIGKVEIVTQQDHIDVLCVLDGTHAVLIEDKTGTEEHGSQLADYIQAVVKRKFDRDHILPIYFKTHEQADLSQVDRYGYKLFNRKELLEALNGCQSGNHILADFRQKLAELDGSFSSHLKLPPSKWHYQSWIGFYQDLKRELGIPNKCWQYVPNPSGGFMGFWWCWLPDPTEDCHVYLQLEETKFCFKVGEVGNSNPSATRSKWHRIITGQASQHGFQAHKPARFGAGAYMTVAVLADEYRATDAQGLLDFGRTLERIKQVERGFRAIVQQNVPPPSSGETTVAA